MKVILYLPDFNGPSSPAYRATENLSAGLTDLGVKHDVRLCRDFDGEIADVAIVNGWLKEMIANLPTGNRTQVIRAQEDAGKPAWCLERGFIGNRDEWSSLAIGGFCATGGDFRDEGVPMDRWDALGVDLKPWREGGDYVLLCAQVPWDAQVDGWDHIRWLEDTAREIRRHTDIPIRFRGHPKAYRKPEPYGDLSEEFRATVGETHQLEVPPIRAFEEDLSAAFAVVCFNSNVGTLATIEGVPVFTSSTSNVDGVACRDLSQIEDHPRPSRAGWCARMGYRQWNMAEFRQALPWRHLTKGGLVSA